MTDLAEPAEAAENEENKPPRRPWTWATPAIAALLIVVGPPLVYSFLVGWVILVALIVVALAAGFVDAATFRFNYLIPTVVGLAYALAMFLYFNEGTWIYLPVMVVAILLGELAGKRMAT